MSSGIDFAQKFLAGEVKAFDLPIEDTQAFAALSEAYSEKNASIESAVMELAHGSCHDLTIGLADALGQQTAMSIVDETGMVVHSGLYNSATQQMLDANGVHAIEAAVAFWSGITRQSCSARLIEVEELYDISGCDEDAAEIALEDFSLIADFIHEELTPAVEPASKYSLAESSKLPTRKVEALWHWGSLDASRKFERGESYEGNLFSMSACPEAWQQICKLGGEQLHMKGDSSTLLDMHSILYGKTKSAKALKQEISAWGVAQGLLEHKTIFKISWYDDELEDHVSSDYLTREEAENEIDEVEEVTLTESSILAGTAQLLAKHGFKGREIIGVEYAVIEWAQSKFAGVFDGVYWAENHDPDRYSAPRAGMFPFDLSRLTEVEDAPEDDDALEGVSKTKWIEFRSKTPHPETPGL
jgi:hypothetical protein